MIITITAITALNGGEETALKIELSDGTHKEAQQFSLLTEQYLDLHIKKGEIERDKYEEIVSAAATCSAYKKGLSLLSYSSCSQKNLYLKLKSRGFDDDACNEALAMLIQRNYLDDNSSCEREAERCLKKLWGKNRIISHLYSKGYDERSVRDLNVIFDGVDFDVNCKKLIERDYKRRLAEAKDDKNAMSKLVAALQRMGYTFSEIKSALRGIL